MKLIVLVELGIFGVMIIESTSFIDCLEFQNFVETIMRKYCYSCVLCVCGVVMVNMLFSCDAYDNEVGSEGFTSLGWSGSSSLSIIKL